MSLQEGLKLVHVLAAIVLVGSAVWMLILAERARRSTDPARMVAFVDNFHWAGMRVFAPSLSLLVIAGLWATIDSPVFDFDQAWISIGLTVWLISFLLGVTYYMRQAKKLHAIVAVNGGGDPGVRASVNRIVGIAYAEMGLFVIVVWAMVTKPGL